MKPFVFFNPTGRLSRSGFWLQTLLVWVVFYGMWSVLGRSAAALWVYVVNLPVLAVLVLLCIRRLHDRNYSAWWLLLMLVPVVGALWLLWQLALRRGMAQDNRWGADPWQSQVDYLVVQ